MKYDIDLFYKYYNDLVDPISAILDVQKECRYVQDYLTNCILSINNIEAFDNLLLRITPMALNEYDGKYIILGFKRFFITTEHIKDPLEELLKKYPIFNSLFTKIPNRSEYDVYTYKFKISSYNELKQLHELFRLLQRREEDA